MKYTIDKQKNFSIFTLEEENLNSLIAPNIKSEFIFLRNEGVRNLILNMEHVHYVDSSGLSAILTANRLWKDYGAFLLSNVTHAPVKKLIEISRLETILTLIPTVSEAIDFVQLNDIEKELTAEEE